MGLCFSDDDYCRPPTAEEQRFNNMYSKNQPGVGETQKQHFKRCFKWLTEEESYEISEARRFCGLIWRCHIYKNTKIKKETITPDDINFPVQYYLDKGHPKEEIKSMMVAFFAKRKFFREKKKTETNQLKNSQIEKFKMADNKKEQYKIGTKIVPEWMKT